MNGLAGSRSGASRWFLGACFGGPFIILGLSTRSARTDIVVTGDLTVDTGTTTTSWTGNVDITSGTSPQVIHGALDLGGQVPSTLFGLHVDGPSHWPSVPFETLRMHNECSGTGDHPCAFWYD